MKARNFNIDFNKPLIMGVLNVTPDSFSDGGEFFNLEDALRRAKQMEKEGANIIDIGGESSRPGAEVVSEEEELRRILPVVKVLAKTLNVPISIDTYKANVARKCLEFGASIINDIKGLEDEDMISVVKEFDCPVILMHMRGIPKTMQKDVSYNNVIEEIKIFFEERISRANSKGVKKIIVDPGIGFGKKLEHNLLILKKLEEFKEFNLPILIGTSRKSFIQLITDEQGSKRLEGTIASSIVAIMNGANIIRVHDVLECKKAVKVLNAINSVK